MRFAVAWAGTDYLRCSWKPGSDVHKQGGREHLNLLAMRLTGVRNPQLTMREWRLGGYVGVAYPAVAWGQRPDGSLMLQISGANANDAMRLGLKPDRVSRIDIQATVHCPETVSRETLAAMYTQLVDAYANPNRRGRKHLPGRYEQERLTVTSGKRGRQGRYLRIYDSAYVHGRESSLYRDTLRFELEVTGDQAAEVYELIAKSEEAANLITGLIEGDARGRGLDVSFGIAPVDMPPLPKRGHVDDGRTIEWLKRAVRPALNRLMERGYRRSVLLDAMGLELNVTSVDE